MAERPSDRAIAQAFFEHCGALEDTWDCTCDNCNILRRARALDAAPSEPSAEHWRAALYEAREFQEWITTQQAELIEQRARELAKEGT